MDIDLLSKMVKELILDNDSVTLPGVGSFQAELVPSTFSDRGYTIHPPYRRLYFSEREGSDTLLTDLYARSNDVSEGDAARILIDFLTEMKEVLKERKTLVFPGLGRLRATRENNFFFVADEDLDIYPAGFGLEPVSLKNNAPEVLPAGNDAAPKDRYETPSAIPVADLPADRPAVPGTAPALAPESSAPESPAPAAPAAVPSAPEAPAPPVQEVPAPEAPVEVVPLAADTRASRSQQPRRNAWRSWLVGIFIVLGILALLCILAVILAEVAPDFIDRLLYSEEELRILRY